MPSPWKHPKTGVFYIRVKVPGAVRPKAGFETYQHTLGTKSLPEAMVLFAEALADLNEEWARLLA